jgi:hypothetical protein
MDRRVLGTLLLVSIAGLAAVTQAPAATPSGVTASFNYAPAAPLTGQVVAFASTSTTTGDNNRVTVQVWDLNNDGKFDDASGTTAARWFDAAGVYAISLKAYDARGHSAVATQNVTVSDPPPPILTPFPVVQMTGKVSREGTRASRVTVDAPEGSTVVVRCRGRGCPVRHQTRIASSGKFETEAKGLRSIRFRRFERRLLRPGLVLKVFVTKGGTVGKYVRFKVRRRRAPLRTDGFVGFGSTTPIACPAP